MGQFCRQPSESEVASTRNGDRLRLALSQEDTGDAWPALAVHCTSLDKLNLEPSGSRWVSRCYTSGTSSTTRLLLEDPSPRRGREQASFVMLTLLSPMI